MEPCSHSGRTYLLDFIYFLGYCLLIPIKWTWFTKNNHLSSECPHCGNYFYKNLCVAEKNFKNIQHVVRLLLFRYLDNLQRSPCTLISVDSFGTACILIPKNDPHVSKSLVKLKWNNSKLHQNNKRKSILLHWSSVQLSITLKSPNTNVGNKLSWKKSA